MLGVLALVGASGASRSPVAQAQAQAQAPETLAEDPTGTTSSTTAGDTSTTTSSSTTSTTEARSTTTTTSESTTTTAESTTTQAPRPAVPSAVSTTEIPAGSIWFAAIVLVVVLVLVWGATRRRPGGAVGRAEPAVRGEGGVEPPAPPPAPNTLHFLVELGRALLDSGESVGRVEATLEEVAEVNGIRGLGAVVLPTALIVSVPEGPDVQTEVRAAGGAKLRMDQADEISHLADEAREGRLEPLEGLGAIARARSRPPRFGPAVRLLGATVFTVGLVLVLRGTWADLLVGAALGVAIGALQLTVARSTSKEIVNYQAFWPLVAAFGVTVTVLSLGRVIDDLSVFVPLVAPLVTFLPGGLLTTGVVELSTGQILSGAGRLASGLMQLVLLALGVVAGTQLVGVPASTIGETPDDPAATVVAWLGVAIFGVGVYLFNGARREALPWMLLVLYVAYAGQVLGGVFFGGTLSAFFGAVAMTPVALLAARQERGPSMLVSFLPGFWLLVPGALGLEGITKIFGDDQLEGVSAMATTVATMVAIALGVLLGLAIGGRIPALTPALRPTTWMARLRAGAGRAPTRSFPTDLGADLDEGEASTGDRRSP